MDHVEYAYTSGMDDAEIERRLEATGTGVLSFAREDEAYAVPMAHFFDGETVYFRFVSTPDSKARAFAAETETACYTVYEAEPTEGPEELLSWSVVATGRLAELSPDDAARFDEAEINERFAPVRVFDEAIEDMEVTLYGLAVERLTGRKTLRE